ncbi:DarT ssDNA thymidine ADP-ribosyltransferase family protein [Stutzerimonas chloritidismutans]|uniref:DUF4433 domain-containing protein n=1 Tax=Stutzerimonas chloritidismutans TaxID=203192 RepID=A0ACC5VFX7_STUCH|nr:DarT ssDNA thymidine ADP-ribosyltransferase family protein [Stutzerimonas chloritidismutans]MBX7271471.1 DUF4433 domain-containing protein [Stutzerimonas chloritidismutans]
MAIQRKPIEDQKWIFHLSSLDNLESILATGLRSRHDLQHSHAPFQDVADPEILDGRASLSLDRCVPFHFFARNPFDGIVQKMRPNERFFYACVARETARRNGYQIMPSHPLGRETPAIYSYEEGFHRIAWDKMNTRDYTDPETKLICMAECLSPASVPISSIDTFIFSCAEDEQLATEISHEIGHRIKTWVNKELFVKNCR